MVHQDPVVWHPDILCKVWQHLGLDRGAAGCRSGWLAKVPVMVIAASMGCATQVPESPTVASDLPPTTDDYLHERFKWEGPVSESPDFRIDNPHGDVRVRTSHRGKVDVTAQVQQFGSEKFDIQILSETAAGAVVVKIADDHPRGRVDLTVLLPPGKSLAVTTRSGLAELKYQGNIDVNTDSGRIFVKAGGDVVANSHSGNIDLALSEENPTQPIVLRTDGDIGAWFLRDASLQLQAHGARGVSIEFPGIETGRMRKTSKQTFGNGGAKVALDSGRGQVRVRVLPPG